MKRRKRGRERRRKKMKKGKRTGAWAKYCGRLLAKALRGESRIRQNNVMGGIRREKRGKMGSVWKDEPGRGPSLGTGRTAKIHHLAGGRFRGTWRESKRGSGHILERRKACNLCTELAI